jgi:hypothetical protein
VAAALERGQDAETAPDVAVAAAAAEVVAAAAVEAARSGVAAAVDSSWHLHAVGAASVAYAASAAREAEEREVVGATRNGVVLVALVVGEGN